MKQKQPILKRARISKKKFHEIVRYFIYDLEATKVSQMTGLTRKTINRYYQKIRTAIKNHQENTTPFTGEVELDESYFGGKRKGKDKRGRCVIDKIPVFGIKKRDGNVYTQIIKNASRNELKPIIRELIEKDSTIYTDSWKAYDSLVLDGYKHYRINHSKEFSRGKGNHINGVENFWGWCKMRLSKFRGLHRHTFLLHLKESEWRFNHRHCTIEEMYHDVLKILRDNF